MTEERTTGAFENMSFLKSAINGVGGAEKPASGAELTHLYTAYIAKIIGEYSSTRVAFLNLADKNDKNEYEALLNDPGVTPISQEGQFTADEFRDRDSYSKETGYRILLIYKKHDFDLACRKMTEYVESLKQVTPKINNPGGMYELLTAWQGFVNAMPPESRQKGARVAGVMLEFIEEIKKANTVDLTPKDKETEELAKNLMSRYTLSDDPVKPERDGQDDDDTPLDVVFGDEII